MHWRKVLVQGLGLVIALWALYDISAGFLGWSESALVMLDIFGVPIDVASWVALSAGYHLFRLRGFGRWALLVLTWLDAVLMLVVGVLLVLGHSSADAMLSVALPQGSADFIIPFGGWIIIFVHLALVVVLNVFLFQPATVALFHNELWEGSGETKSEG